MKTIYRINNLFLSQINPELTLQKFMPYFSNKIFELTEDDNTLEDELIDKKLIYCLKLINKLVECEGIYLLDYRELIIKILDKTLNFKCHDVYQNSSILLKNVLKSSTLLHVLEFRKTSKNDNNLFHVIIVIVFVKNFC